MGLLSVLTIGTIVGPSYVNYTGSMILMDLRRELYAHLQSLSLRFFADNRVGELVSRMSSDVQDLKHLLTTDLITLTRYLLTIVGGVIIMVALNWRLTLFIMLVLPLIIVLATVMSAFARRYSRRAQDELANATVIAEESFHNVREVKSFVREEFEVARFDRAIDNALESSMRMVRSRALLGPLVHFLFMASNVLILWFGGREVMAGRLDSGTLISFILYVVIVGQMFAELAGLYSRYQEALGAITRFFQILDMEPDLQDRPGAQTLDSVEGRITFDAVDFGYAGDQDVLRQINLDIAPGEIIALVGPSGAGKSTMFNLIPRFYDVTSGSVQIDGIDVRDVTQASLRAQIGIVPQETLLFGGTIRENILYGRLDATHDELIAAARAANAHDFIMDMPDGYNTLVGERGIRLSGGQRQRIAIARAILKDPRILLLDEATSSLDNESEHQVQEALERLMQDRTTVIIAHRLSTIRVAHRIAVLENGQIVEIGTHDDLLTRGGLYAHLYQMQFHRQQAAFDAANRPAALRSAVPA